MRNNRSWMLLLLIGVSGCANCNRPPEPQLLEARGFLIDGASSDCPFSTFSGNGGLILSIETRDAGNNLLWGSAGPLPTAGNFGNNYAIMVPSSGQFTLKAVGRGPSPPSCGPCFAKCTGTSSPSVDGTPEFKGQVSLSGPAATGATYTIPMDFDVCSC